MNNWIIIGLASLVVAGLTVLWALRDGARKSAMNFHFPSSKQRAPESSNPDSNTERNGSVHPSTGSTTPGHLRAEAERILKDTLGVQLPTSANTFVEACFAIPLEDFPAFERDVFKAFEFDPETHRYLGKGTITSDQNSKWLELSYRIVENDAIDPLSKLSFRKGRHLFTYAETRTRREYFLTIDPATGSCQLYGGSKWEG